MNYKAEVTSNGIRELLRTYDWSRSICEFIWNGFDAEATTVGLQFTYSTPPLDTAQSLTIRDNGEGISAGSLRFKFRRICESDKAQETDQPKNHSLPHGKMGKGRLTFFTFARKAKWTTYWRERDAVRGQEIVIEADSLDNYSPTPIEDTSTSTGTEVEFLGLVGISQHEIKSILIPDLKLEFGWFLELNRERGFKIMIDGEPLEWDETIQEASEHRIEIRGNRFSIRVVLWRAKLNAEYSKYYYIGSDLTERWKENTTLNNKGDNFYHSVFIKSEFFDEFQWSESTVRQPELFKNRTNEIFRQLSDELSNLLNAKRGPFIDEFTKRLVAEY